MIKDGAFCGMGPLNERKPQEEAGRKRRTGRLIFEVIE